MMRHTVSSAAALVASSLFSAGVHADTLFTIAESSGGEIRWSKLWIDRGSYRLESSQGSDKSVEIFTDDKLYLLNFNDNSYTVLDRERLASNAEAHRRQTQATLPGTRELQPTEEIKMVGERPCHVWEVLVDGELRQVLCVMPLKALRTGTAIRETMVRYNELLATFGATTPGMPWSDVETTEGIPVIVTTFADRKPHSSSVSIRIDTEALASAKRYRVPSDMREQPQL